MRRQVLRKKMVAMVLVGLGLCMAGAHATTMINSDYLIGTTPGSPASPSDELSRLNDLIAAYNGGSLPSGDTLAPGSNVPAPKLPTAAVNLGQGDVSGTTFEITLEDLPYGYLVVKWADVDTFYYVAGLSGEIEVINDVVFNRNNKPQGASHYDLFDPVPDGGTTVFFLGFALSALALLAYRSRRPTVAGG